jgi:hypothetical protein
MTDNTFVAVYEVGSQGILIDTGFRTDLETARGHIENGNYSFEKGKEYVCLPCFTGHANRK